jgi:hypothetical protein
LRIGQDFVGFDLFKFGFLYHPGYGPGDISWPGACTPF